MAISYPIYIHFLGYRQLGLWLLLSAVMAIVQLTSLGVGPALTSLVAEAEGKKDYQALIRHTSTGLAMLLGAGVIATFSLWICSDLIAKLAHLGAEDEGVVRTLLPWAGLMSALALMAQACSGVLSGLGRTDVASYLDTASRAIALAVAFALLTKGGGVESVLIATVVAQLTSVCLAAVLARRIQHRWMFSMECISRASIREVWARSRGLMAGSIFTMFLHPFNRFAIARWSGIEDVPVYEIAFSGSFQLRAIFESAVRALAPEASRIWGESGAKASEQISHLRSRFLRLLVATGTPTWLAIALGAEPLLLAWLGPKYRPGMTEAFRYMLVGSYLSLLSVPAFYVAVGLGRSNVIASGQAIIAVLNILLVLGTALAVGRISPIGMAVALMAATGAATLYYNWAASVLLVRTQETQ